MNPLKKITQALRRSLGESAERKLLIDMQRRLKRMEGQQETLNKIWLRTRHLEPAVQAILRALHFDRDWLEYPDKLTAQRFRLTSQNQEDGITLALLKAIGTTNRRFVEIGSGLSGGNSAFLAHECGWTGLMVDGDAAHMQQVGRRFPGVTAVNAWVTRENINPLLQENGVAGEVDLFSLDLDGNDYWIWDAMSACSPRLMIVEYNSMFGPERSVTVPYDPGFDRRKYRLTYYGASLSALVKLAARKEYRLVAVEPTGVNAFFLRNDVGSEVPACEPGRAYRLLERYDVLMQQQQEDVFRYVKEANLPLVEIP